MPTWPLSPAPDGSPRWPCDRAPGPAHHEAVVGLDLLSCEQAPVDVFVDNAYSTCDVRRALTTAGHRLFIKPALLRPAVPRWLHPGRLRHRHPNGTVTCPAEHTAHVSRSGFYDWRSRPMSATAERRQRLRTMIQAVFDANHETYGYHRIHVVLTRSGEQVSPELVRQLMRQMGLQPVQPRPWRPVTTLVGDPCDLPDLVELDFTAERPGTKLVGDITYIPTWEGFLYLATVIDCHSKMVVGWAMADHFRTSLINAELDSAAGHIDIEPGCVFHSDRGSN